MAVSELPLKREEGDNTDESYASPKRDSGMTEKSSQWRDLKEYVTSKEGWFGHYVCRSVIHPKLNFRVRTDMTDNALQDYLYLVTPNVWPLNKIYKDHEPPFYGLNDEVPILLTIILGLQHALTMIGSVV